MQFLFKSDRINFDFGIDGVNIENYKLNILTFFENMSEAQLSQKNKIQKTEKFD